MARRAEHAERRGRFRRLKLKLGGRDALDVDRVRAVRATTLPLQVDVNEYWTLDEALDSILSSPPAASTTWSSCWPVIPTVPS